MVKAKKGDNVTVHYTGKLVSGEVFDTTQGEEPLGLTLGEGDFIDGFEKAIIGMVVGEKKRVTLPPEEAFGEKSEDTEMDVPLEDMPDDLDLKVGDELEITDEDGQDMFVIVSKITDETVTLDCASPLTGETLVFDLELVAID